MGVFSVFSGMVFRVALVLFWGSVFSVLADLSTGRAWVMRLDSARAGLVFWPLVLAVIAIPQAVHLVFYMIAGQSILLVGQFSLILIPVLGWLVAGYVLRRKGYIGKGRAFQLSLLDLLIMYSAALLGLGIDQASRLMPGMPLFRYGAEFTAEIVKLFVVYYAFFALARKLPEDAPVVPPRGGIVLVNPVLGGHFFGIASALFRSCPTFFASIRAFTPPGYRFDELNHVLWTESYARPGVLVAISCYTMNAAVAYSIARAFRAAGAKVVMGGPHAGLFPGEALEFCDAVVVGPAEGVWARIIDDYESGRLAGVYQGSCSAADLDRLHRYFLSAPASVAAETLMISRGCKFRCYFCTHNSILNTDSRRQEEVIALIKHSRARSVAFLDSNIFMESAYSKELFRQMIPLGIQWVACASIDIAQDEEVVELLRRSGCSELMIGYEIATGSQEEKRKGKFLLAGDYDRLTRRLKKAGIRVRAQFMFGFPTDDWAGLWRLWTFCFRLFPHITGLAYMSPIPGSLYYDDMVRDDRLVNLNWDNFSGYKLTCVHPRMGSPVLLKSGFTLIHVLFFTTTSRFGFCCLLLMLAGGWCLFQR